MKVIWGICLEGIIEDPLVEFDFLGQNDASRGGFA